MDLATHYTLWAVLDGANCIATCKHCDCCKVDHSKVIKFLAGLNESYSIIRSQIIMKKHILVLSEIYNLLDEEYNKRNLLPVQNAIAF